MYMQTIVQLASESIGNELSASPILRFPLTNAHIPAIAINEMTRPGMVVTGL